MTIKDIQNLTHEDINKMSVKELRNTLRVAQNALNRRIFGYNRRDGTHVRGSLEVIRDNLLKDSNYPVPHAFRTGLNDGGDLIATRNKKSYRNNPNNNPEISNYNKEVRAYNKEVELYNREVRKHNAPIIQQWYEGRHQFFVNRGLEDIQSSNISQLRHALVDVRNSLDTKTSTIKGWNKVLSEFMETLERAIKDFTGKEGYSISRRDYARFFRTFNRANEYFNTTNAGSRYELYRKVIDLMNSYPNLEPDELADELIRQFEDGNFDD